MPSFWLLRERERERERERQYTDNHNSYRGNIFRPYLPGEYGKAASKSVLFGVHFCFRS